MLAATASADLGRVVALGDSLAAGTNQGAAIGTYPRCGQTDGSYVELAMKRVKKSAWVNSVCNGGHSGLMEYGWYGIGGTAQNGAPFIPPQFNSLNGTEDVVIVATGANEAFFGQITKICLGHDGSSETPPRTYTLSDNACSIAFPGGLRPYTLNSEQLMGPLIDGIHSRSPNAEVILVGVPRITPRDGVGCMPDPVLTLADAPVWAVWEDTLRDSMIKVANEHDATYVDNGALSGPEHSMCAPANMRWMNPWTVQNVSYPGTPLHNTPWGADAMADTLVNAIKAAGKNTGTPNAPTLTRTFPSATPTALTSQSFSYSGVNGYSFKCRLDNAAYATCPSGPHTRSNLSAGPHSYSVIQIDPSGNRSPAAIVTWTVDTTAPAAPTVTRTSPVANPTNSRTQTITYAGAESGGTFQCKLDSANYAACPSSPVLLSNLSDGSHTYSVTQTDAAGNLGPAASVTWTVNTVLPPAPTVTRTSPTAAVTNSTTQVITYSGNQAGGTFQCSLDSAPPTTCSSSPITLTGLGNGSHTFSVRQTDVLGNIGSATTVAWTVDLIPPAAPTVTRTSPTASPTNSPSQTITFSGAEPGGTLQCKLDSAAFAACPASPVTLNGLGGGSHSYSVMQTDAVGNVGAVAAVSWTIDTVPPPTPNVSGPSGVSALDSASISFSDSEPGVSFQCKLDTDLYAPCPASPVNLNGLAIGDHTYFVTATDAAGNTSAAGTASWTVDPSGFTVSITASPSNPATVPTASFSFAASVISGTTYQCKLDGAAAFSSCSSPKTYNGLSDGPHTFTVRGVNGSLTTPEVSRTWVVDTTAPGAPTLTRTSPTANPTNLTSQTFSLAAAEAGGVLSCKLDNEPVSTCPGSPITVTGLGSGPHTFTVTQTDAAGNTGSAATVTWTVDTLPPNAPTVARTNPTANPTNSTSQTLTYSGIEGGATAQCKLDTATFGPCPVSPHTFAGLGEGSHTLLVTQTDAAGNVSTPGSVTWVVDTVAPSPPSVLRTDPTASLSNLTTQQISLAGTESGTSLRCKLDSANYAPCPSSPATFTGFGQGAHTLLVTQTDAANNVSQPASVTWSVDSLPPGAPAIGFNRPAVTTVNSATIGYAPAEPGGTFECSMDSAAWMPCPGNPVNLTLIPEGQHNYMIRQIDAAGNEGSVAQVAWVVDSVVPPTPTVDLTSPTSSPTNQTTASITVTANESGGELECKLDNAAYEECPSSLTTLNGLTDGSHTYYARQIDSAGNVSLAGSVNWIVDTVAPGLPSVTRTSPTGNPTASTSQVITWAGAEAGGTFQCKLDSDSFAPCPSSPVTLSGLSDGTHTYSVAQTDASGNTGSVATVTWVVDTAAPSPPTVTRSVPTADPTNSTSQTFTYSGEPGGTFECKLDAAPYAACTGSPVMVTGLSDGSHSYSVRQIDALGNVGAPTTLTWTVDITPPPAPVVTRSSPTATPTNSTSQVISYAGLEAGATAQCKLDSAAYSACGSSPFTLSGLTHGTHTVSITQTDSVGNISAVGTVSWVVDTVVPNAPVVTRTAPSANPTTSTAQTITYSGEAGSTFQCKRDLEAYAPCAGSPVTITGLADGTHTYSVTQTDAAGNLGSAATVTWVVDTTAPSPPTVTRTAPTANPTNSTSQSYSYSGEPGGTFQCKLDAAAYSPCASSPVALTGLSEGTHSLSVTQTDALGHVSPPTTITWTIDTTLPNAPTVTRTNPTANPTNSTSQTISYSGLEAGATAQCKLDNAPYAPCAASPITLGGLSSGTHTYSITQQDSAGNVSVAGVVSWVVDLTPPPTPIVSGPSGTTGLRSATIAYSDSEAGVTFQCKLDSAPYAACPPSPISLTDLTDGSHTYFVTATDPAGNVSAAGTATWTVDPSIFGVSITSAPSNPSTETTAAFTFISTIPGSTFECKLDAEDFASCTSPKTYTNLSDGSHTFTVRAKNGSQTTTDESRTWFVDSTPPGAPTITRASPTTTPTNQTQQTLLIVGSEPGGVLSCKMNDSAYQTCPESPVILSDLADDVYTLSVTQTDAAGHISQAASVTWEVDTIAPAAPTVTRSSPSASPTSSTSQTISYSGEAGGTYRCKLDAGSYAPCESSPLTLSGLSLGSHTFSVRQTDAAGNTSSAAAVAWTIVAPTPPDPPIGPTDTTTVTQLSAKLSSIAPKSITPARSGATFSLKARGSVGSFRVTLSAAATVSVRLERVVTGASRASSTWTKFKLKSGQTKIYLSGRAKNRPLPAGTYRVRLTVGGSKSNLLSKSFKIKR